MSHILHKQLSDQVIDAAFTVHSKSGPGLAEVLYKRALVIELPDRGLCTGTEKYYPVFYNQQLTGQYFADVIVEDSLIIEIKAVKELNMAMQAQRINYLRISGIRVGYLCNFAPQVLHFKRFVL